MTETTQEYKDKHTVTVGNWFSKCGNCGGGADANETHHTIDYPGYSPRDARPGCGIKFEYVASDYFNIGSFYTGRDITTEEYYAEQYPHLQWNGFDEASMKNF